jgi:hypothetical protein
VLMAPSNQGVHPLRGLIQLLRLDLSADLLFPIGALALLGAIVCLIRRSWLLPIWLIVIFAFQTRATVVYAAPIFAMLAGVGLVQGLLPLLKSGPEHIGIQELGDTSFGQVSRTGRTIILIGVTYTIIASTLIARIPLRGLSPSERAAMEWIKNSTPIDARFIVFTSDPTFDESRTSEWFPALSERTNINLVQAYEWMPDQEYARRLRLYRELSDCGYRDAGCLIEWSHRAGTAFNFVYLAKEVSPRAGGTARRWEACCFLGNALKSDQRFAVVYDGRDAVIYRYDEARGFP